MQLVELQGNLEKLQAQGLGLAAISYDSPELLAKFSQLHGITYPLLSDAGSEVIRRYGIFNTTTEEGTRAYGIPYPGTFVVDTNGVVKARFFEETHRERRTAASILVALGSGTAPENAPTTTTDHVEIRAWATDREVRPGTKVSLVLDMTPRERMHLYAPGNASYTPVTLTLSPQPWLAPDPQRIPTEPQAYDFAPLNETVLVYQEPFTLVQDVWIRGESESEKLLMDVQEITIEGTLEYQACDDEICYLPVTVPVSWQFEMGQLDRVLTTDR